MFGGVEDLKVGGGLIWGDVGAGDEGLDAGLFSIGHLSSRLLDFFSLRANIQREP